MTKISLAILLFQFLSLAATSVAQISNACAQSETALNDDSNLQEATLLMGAGFPEVPRASDPIMVNTTLNWGGVSTTNLYNRMRNECEANQGHKLCMVRTKVKFAQEIAGQEGINFVEEQSKPVCFPPKCSDEDVAIIEAEPGRCNPDSPVRSCEILSYEVDCPADRPTEEGSCSQTLNTLTSPFFIQRNILEGRVRAGCPQNIAVAGSTNVCTVVVGEVEVKSIRDYSAKEGDEYYQDYKKQCYSSGGKVCEASIVARQRAEREGLGEFFFVRTYFLQPICMATECTSEDEEGAIKNQFVNSISGAPCNLNDGSCELEISGINCGLTMSPTTMSERQPTASPTKQIISDVCQDSSNRMELQLATTNAALLANFPDVVEESDPLVIQTIQHWDQISNNAVYSQMKSQCEAKGNVMCKAMTKVKFSEEIAGFEANNTIIERNKPVCFPPGCGEDDFLILEPSPGRCNPEILPCTIEDYAVQCIQPRAAVNETCTQNLDPITDQFFIARNLLESRIQASCVSGGTGRFCTVNYEDLNRVTTRDFSGYETAQSYLDYEEDCLSNGGQVCHVDMYVQTSGETIDSFVGLTVRTVRTFIDFPTCLNLKCQDSELQDVVKRRIPGCDVANGCTVTIARMECDGGRPTTSPVPTASPTVNPISGQCLDSSSELGTSVAAANAAFQALYPDVPNSVDPLSVDTTHNWDGLEDRPLYGRLQGDCESQTGYTLCTVDTKVEFKQDVGDGDISNTITEMNKPVCFPPMCADSEASIVEPNPGRCNPDILPCTIVSYNVNCPANRPTSQGTCVQTLDPITSPFFLGRNILEGQIQASCATGGSTICSVDTEDIEARSTRDFTDHETNEVYLAYENQCLNNGGQICRVDMTVQNEGDTVENAVGLSVQVQRERIDMPICISTVCSGNEEIYAVIKSRIPRCEGDSCTVDIKRMECDGGREPTKSPSPTATPLISEKCQTANNALTVDVLAANAALMANYQDIPETSDPVGLQITLNWGEVADAQLYERMKTGCANQSEGNTLCTVNTKTKFSIDIEGRSVTREVTEMDKPVCFPNTCDEDSVEVLEPNPGRCNPDVQQCTIESYKVDCPEDRPAPTGTCTQTLGNTDSFFINRNILEARIYSSCAAGGSECSLEADDILLKSSADFTNAKTTTEYGAYKDRCTIAEGQICHVNMVVKSDIANDELFSLVSLQQGDNTPSLRSERSFKEYPVCVSLQCGGQEITELVKSQLPGCLAGSCEVDIQAMECDVSLFLPTASPVKITNSPTKIPSAPTGNEKTPTTDGDVSGISDGSDTASSGFSPRCTRTFALSVLICIMMVVTF